MRWEHYHECQVGKNLNDNGHVLALARNSPEECYENHDMSQSGKTDNQADNGAWQLLNTS
jgi:hypothetical protein